MKYERIPLMVDVIFTREGNMMPKTLIFDDQRFDIRKVVKKRRFCLRTGKRLPRPHMLADTIRFRIFQGYIAREWGCLLQSRSQSDKQ